ncbi:helix-turn-helix domain-containing protein [uncultured Chryseobacterium sp.]|uniref:helix-turn-helix domain-containing protein n=1 Tax=uncultured Chryseobacterium sp. TaxID=259322 RepID=UPI0025DF3499|nr:helix-turn-helix domain-containing protein [uncultured Chryseobacterium sp.]
MGTLIKKRSDELGIGINRLSNFLKCTEEEIKSMYKAESIDSHLLLRWSKILEYDFFRIYSQHLILHAPATGNTVDHSPAKKTKNALPQFRKNIYSKELIDYMLELVETGRKTKIEIIEQYKIPKTTLYKWIAKYRKISN